MDKRAIVLLAAFTMAASGVAIGAITNSDHDFTGEGWADSEICKPCHVPHNAVTGLIAPLWNHEVTTATYTLYSSSTLDSSVGQPEGRSKLCLSCHDGTVAIDNFGGFAGGTVLIPARPPSERTSLTTTRSPSRMIPRWLPPMANFMILPPRLPRWAGRSPMIC